MQEQGRNCGMCNKISADIKSSPVHIRGQWNQKDNMFPIYLLLNLNQYRRQNILCDVILVTDKDEYPAHKAVLASASTYFKAMFSGKLGFTEAAQTKIPLINVSSKVFEQILSYIYTAELTLTEDNVEDLFVAADFLSIDPLLNLCCHFLNSMLNYANCIGIYLSAKAHNCPDLALAAKHHALEHFHDVIREEEYLHLPNSDFLEFLRSDSLSLSGEKNLLQVVSKWVDFEPSERLQCLRSILKEIDISKASINEVSNPIVKEAIEKLGLFLTASSDGISKNPRRYSHAQGREVIVAIGGESSSGFVFNCMECYTLGYEGWKSSIPTAVSRIAESAEVMPAMKVQRSFAAVCSSGCNIFVVGGVNGEVSTDACEFYSVLSNEWGTLAPLPIAIHGSGATHLNQGLRVLGGRSPSQIERRCWAFQETCNSWEPRPPMEYRRVHHCVASLNNTLYAFGGMGGMPDQEDTYLSSAECYSPFLQSWVSIAPMNEPRAFFGVATVGTYIYVFGGFNGTSWLRSTECYDTISNQWTSMARMCAPRSSFGTAILDGRIYVMGGTDGVHLLNTVEKFNPHTNRWHCSISMRTPRIGVGASTVKVPVRTK